MSSTKVVTGKVRFSFVFLFEPQQEESGEAKYKVTLLIPKKDKKTLKKIEAAIEAAKEIGKSKKWGGKIPKNLKNPLKDGDAEEFEDYPENAGHWIIRTTSNKQPGIVDEDRNEILDNSELYSGCYGRASITFAPYNWEGTSKGVGAYINGVQKLEDGDPLVEGHFDADVDFADDDDDDLMG